jgi:hypothetical protein
MSIEQIQFSALIKSFLTEYFPQFLKEVNFKEDGSFDCELRSPSDIFSIWIATYNSEITIGLTDPGGDTDIHTHISCYEEDDVEEATDRLKEMIQDIKDERIVLYKSSLRGYHWSTDIVKTIMNKKDKETIEVLHWKNQV